MYLCRITFAGETGSRTRTGQSAGLICFGARSDSIFAAILDPWDDSMRIDQQHWKTGLEKLFLMS